MPRPPPAPRGERAPGSGLAVALRSACHARRPRLWRVRLLVLPSAAKLSDRDGGRAYLRIVAQLVNNYRPRVDPVELVSSSKSMHRWRTMVVPEMSPIAVAPLHARFTAARITFVELARRAENPRRKDDRLFASHLIDLVTAILGAPVSAETKALLEERAR